MCLFGCASPNVERLPLADGTWLVKCKFALEQCVKEVEKLCPDPTYQITRGSSVRRLYGVEPGKTEIRTSELTVTCGRDAVEEAQKQAMSGDAGAPDGAATSSRACTPGATQQCFGPGACQGAQACRADGAGFLPCDCGQAKAPPTSTPIPDAGGQ
jgi:hypothetical protein